MDLMLDATSPSRELGLGDALIAATAAGLGATAVTLNRPDFERLGASVLGY